MTIEKLTDVSAVGGDCRIRSRRENGFPIEVRVRSRANTCCACRPVHCTTLKLSLAQRLATNFPIKVRYARNRSPVGKPLSSASSVTWDSTSFGLVIRGRALRLRLRWQTTFRCWNWRLVVKLSTSPRETPNCGKSLRDDQKARKLKHQNISAILDELGLPFIRGYKPRETSRSFLRGRS